MKSRKRFICILLALSVCEYVNGVTVYTENGGVSGTKLTTFQGRVVDSFLGIPYGKPPVEENRLRDPQPAEKWEGIRSADTFGSKCIQYTYYNDLPVPVEGSEDCLFLNIYTPDASNSSRLNVIVYIHGGCFMIGSGNTYTPYYILDHQDLVFVTLNYRLGPLGFLSTQDNVIPGNFGLKDQVLALKWIKNNINQFGGDSNKITLAGTSAGGASVHLHYLSPLSRDLFKNGISESGTAFDPWAFTESPLQKARMLSAAVGCPTNTSNDILECLQRKDAVSLVLPIKRLFLPWVYNPFSPFGPVVEPESSNAFLSKTPYNIIAEGEVKDAPWMTSITTEEGLYPAATFITNDTLMQELDENWNAIAPHLLDYNYTVGQERQVEVSQNIRQHYFGERRINNESRDTLVRLVSDRLFGVGAEKAIRLQASVSKSPVYFFVFGYRGNFSVSEAFCHCDEYLGVCHLDSTIYLLLINWFNTSYESEQDKNTVELMTNIWTSFANSSVPFVSKDFFIPPVSPDIGAVGNLTYFRLTLTNEIESTADLTDYTFWDSLGMMENENATYSIASGGSSIIYSVLYKDLGTLILSIMSLSLLCCQ